MKPVDITRVRAFVDKLRSCATDWFIVAAGSEGRFVTVGDLAALLEVYEAACAQVDADGPLLPQGRRRDSICVAVDTARGYTAEDAIAARLRELP